MIMRLSRVKAEGQGFYHAMSRTVPGLNIFDTSGKRCENAEDFIYSNVGSGQVLWNADFGLRADVRSAFHLVFEVPKPRPLSIDEILERIAALHPEEAQALRVLHARLAEQPGGLEQLTVYWTSTGGDEDPSIFIKELKGGFAQWYNRKYSRYGALWAERFKSVLLEAGRALATVVAYVSLNPVRAGLCEDPKDYRYCGYAEAVAKGTLETMERIRIALGLPPEASTEELAREYRKLLFSRFSAAKTRPQPLTWQKPSRSWSKKTENSRCPGTAALQNTLLYRRSDPGQPQLCGRSLPTAQAKAGLQT